ncbi:MAG TPA: hypothetical protein DCY03_02810 [Planctomycetaceae bacterium]|nr:hypothetical protein [Planctomycetaceae bacterium]
MFDTLSDTYGTHSSIGKPVFRPVTHCFALVSLACLKDTKDGLHQRSPAAAKSSSGDISFHARSSGVVALRLRIVAIFPLGFYQKSIDDLR